MPACDVTARGWNPDTVAAGSACGKNIGVEGGAVEGIVEGVDNRRKRQRVVCGG